jgi:anti-anti-sigma regulatory factor
MTLSTTDPMFATRPRPLRESRGSGVPIPDSSLRFGPKSLLIRPEGPGIDGSRASLIVASVRHEFSSRRKPFKRLLIDLESIQVPSSMAIGMLLELSRVASSVDATCHLAVQPRFREVLGMLKLDGRYTMERNAPRLEELLR